MKFKSLFLSAATVLVIAQTISAEDITGIVTSRLVQPDGTTIAFVLTDPAKPNTAVVASGADAAALLPRNQVKLSGEPAKGVFGPELRVKAGTIVVKDTNQPFKSIAATSSDLKNAVSIEGKYVQISGVTFASGKFDNSGTAQVKMEDGTSFTLLVSKGAAGCESPKNLSDVFGVVVNNGGSWKIVAARFLPANRKEMTKLAGKATCVTCHNPDTKVVGPTYRDIAANYRHDPAAKDKLRAQMKNGGSGKWGNIPMPPLASTVSPDEMQQLADWILSYRWDALLAE